METPQAISESEKITAAGKQAIGAWIRHNQRGISRDKGIRPQGFAAKSIDKPESSCDADAHYHRIVESQLASFAGEKTDLLPHQHILKKVIRHAFGIGTYPWATIGFTQADLKLMLGADPEAKSRFWVAEITEIVGLASLLNPFQSDETEVSDLPSPEQVAEAVERLQKAG